MFFEYLYRAQHEFKNERNLKKLTCNDLYSKKRRIKGKVYFCFFLL